MIDQEILKKLLILRAKIRKAYASGLTRNTINEHLIHAAYSLSVQLYDVPGGSNVRESNYSLTY